ncbi:RNA-dependent ATPase [Starmerella bacillaris]|uniref:RNA helicase n=1 Tax=Starmerella bacillaris TaxID=1247836 RepID=A0AAV5RLP8_STABA|nr:RNA-dependent ATPase [Starmerella bacillaris]
MDLFNILSKGARISKEQKNELKKFAAEPAKLDDHAVDRSLNFFAAPQKVRKTYVEPELKEIEIQNSSQAQEFRRLNRVKVTGDAPLPVTSFQDLRKWNLDSKLTRNLAKFGFEKPTAIQSESIPILLENHDLLACAPTGSGKTLAFVTPILQQLINLKIKTENSEYTGPTALIVSPTRELANQIYEVAAQLSKGTAIQVALLNKKQITKLRNNNAGNKQKMDIIISTPMRLVEGVKEDLYSLGSVQYMVLDEADKLLGDEFVHQTDEILTFCTNSHIVKAIFSATMPSNVEELAHTVMTAQPCRVIVGHKEGAADTVKQELLYCGSEAGKLTAIRQMMTGGEIVPPILVFVQSIQRAKALFHELLYDKVNVDVIHSDLPQNQRERTINQFKKGDIWVLICTDVLARGIDFQGVNLVINYDVPMSAQAYVHRIGRTGRAGREGKAITFYTNVDVETLRPVVNVMRQSGLDVSDWLVQATNKRNRRDKPVKRTRISTVPKVFKNQERHKNQVVQGTKRKQDLLKTKTS